MMAIAKPNIQIFAGATNDCVSLIEEICTEISGICCLVWRSRNELFAQCRSLFYFQLMEIAMLEKKNQDLLLLYRFFGTLIERERRRLNKHLRRARDKGLPATLTLGQWLRIIERFNWGCACCDDGPFESIEHLTPVARGGGTTAVNCVPCCLACNDQHNVVLSRLERLKATLRDI